MQDVTLSEADRTAAPGQPPAATTVEARILLSLPDIVWCLDQDRRFRLCNAAFEAFTGKTQDELAGQMPPFVDAELPQFIRGFMAHSTECQTGQSEHSVRDPRSGQRIYFETTEIALKNPDGTPGGFVCVAHDMTRRKTLELELTASRNELFQHAYYDPMTGLPNLRHFSGKLAEAVAGSGGRQGTVLKIDLDRFSAINETIGRVSGDHVLVELSQRLREEAEIHGDFLARIDGASFAMVVYRDAGRDDIARDCERLLTRISKPFFVEQKLLTVTASIGASCFPEQGDNPDQLLGQADSALLSAKRGGQNTWRIFDESLIDEARERFELEADLRKSIESDNFTAHFQAKINLQTGEIAGVEALMRWNHPEMGSIPPGVFIPLAEQTGLIIPLGERIMTDACHFAHLWNDGSRNPVRVSVNLSPRQIMLDDFLPLMKGCISRAGCRPEWVELEITESMLMSDPQRINELMRGLSALGVAVSIDDFGTGYSAISSLTRYPIARLKIDRSLVHTRVNDGKPSAIARTIVAMARELGIKCVAEGIELAAEADMMRQIGCDEGQGFLWHKPMPEEDFFRWVARYETTREAK
ncbi:putative bifunctional diguanylate cyclase/phosphodiesterase [Rhizobium sp. C1]|uniref:putative bifunctional diguanylate cyclase/phosphodiesterase n=1 Tax=Rhizobium sp. C1 TaxID=1349799 RepID=UPI001E3CB858|nr:GGDEF domain-containing phosphodiesterase [Rhizobium sp. C1]MCD2179663.1 EAL domain-containing protein [Rhizobium sp. C1]